MGPYAILLAAFVAAHPGAAVTYVTQGGPWPFQCIAEVTGGGVYAYGWGEMPDRWDPEPIEDTCDRAAFEAITYACEWHEDQQNPPAYCQF